MSNTPFEAPAGPVATDEAEQSVDPSAVTEMDRTQIDRLIDSSGIATKEDLVEFFDAAGEYRFEVQGHMHTRGLAESTAGSYLATTEGASDPPIRETLERIIVRQEEILHLKATRISDLKEITSATKEATRDKILRNFERRIERRAEQNEDVSPLLAREFEIIDMDEEIDRLLYEKEDAEYSAAMGDSERYDDEDDEDPLAGDVDRWVEPDPPETLSDRVARQYGDHTG